MKGIVYTETVIHSAPAQFAEQVPYQIAIVDLASGGRVTGRVAEGRAVIGDTVEMLEERNGIPFFRVHSPEKEG